MARKYTGFDGYASGKRKGTEQFVKEFVKFTGGAFWNNGTYLRRPVRGQPNRPSNHGTGRAIDFSYRGAPYKGCGDRKVAEKWIDWLVEHAEVLQIEMIVDYMPKPFGRAWACDREKWRVFWKPTISSGGKSYADWIHVEVTPDVADDPDYYKAVFTELANGKVPSITQPPKRELKVYRGKPIRRGEKDRELVAQIQRAIMSAGIKVRGGADGIFGPMTEKAVMQFQGKYNCYPDGWIGPQTWGALEPFL
jgi:hypothetical protein